MSTATQVSLHDAAPATELSGGQAAADVPSTLYDPSAAPGPQSGPVTEYTGTPFSDARATAPTQASPDPSNPAAGRDAPTLLAAQQHAHQTGGEAAAVSAPHSSAIDTEVSSSELARRTAAALPETQTDPVASAPHHSAPRHSASDSTVAAAEAVAAQRPATVAAGPQSSALAQGALGGCAVGGIGLAMVGFLGIAAIVGAVVFFSRSDTRPGATSRPLIGAGTSERTSRTPVVGDQIETRSEFEMDMTVPKRGKVKVIESKHRRITVEEVAGGTASKLRVQYVLARTKTNGEAVTNDEQGQTFLISRATTPATVKHLDGRAVPKQLSETVLTDDLDVGPATFLPTGDMTVGQAIAMPGAAFGLGSQLKKGTLTFRGPAPGGPGRTRFDVSLDIVAKDSEMTMSGTLLGSFDIDVATSRGLTFETKGPITVTSGGLSGKGFMKLTETFSYQDK